MPHITPNHICCHMNGEYSSKRLKISVNLNLNVLAKYILIVCKTDAEFKEDNYGFPIHFNHKSIEKTSFFVISELYSLAN